jgi:2-phospho-L-lactate guanylyltransferase
MAETVVAAAAPLPVAIACDDVGVGEWARGLGARVIWTPGLGLNGAVQAGAAVLAEEGARTVLVAHADLPHAARLATLLNFPGITLVPDRHDDGTNVIVVPLDAGFTFAYGPNSFRRHVAESRRLGLPLRIARRPELGWDVDTPDDLPVRATT